VDNDNTPSGLGFIHKYSDHIKFNNQKLNLACEHEIPPTNLHQQMEPSFLNQFQSPQNNPASSSSSLASAASMQHLAEEYRAPLRTARHHPDADPVFIEHLQIVLGGLNDQGVVPERPTTVQMEPLFRRHRYPVRSTGRGSRGGSINHECLWPGCQFKHTLQKCIDHFFSQHVTVKFFLCGVNDW
jgi:hypothetical protein